jgi:sugar (pentulose or hexulose) kinase
VVLAGRVTLVVGRVDVVVAAVVVGRVDGSAVVVVGAVVVARVGPETQLQVVQPRASVLSSATEPDLHLGRQDEAFREGISQVLQ